MEIPKIPTKQHEHKENKENHQKPSWQKIEMLTNVI